MLIPKIYMHIPSRLWGYVEDVSSCHQVTRYKAGAPVLDFPGSADSKDIYIVPYIWEKVPSPHIINNNNNSYQSMTLKLCAAAKKMQKGLTDTERERGEAFFFFSLVGHRQVCKRVESTHMEEAFPCHKNNLVRRFGTKTCTRIDVAHSRRSGRVGLPNWKRTCQISKLVCKKTSTVLLCSSRAGNRSRTLKALPLIAHLFWTR